MGSRTSSQQAPGQGGRPSFQTQPTMDSSVHHRPITSHSVLSSLCLGGKQEELRASLKKAQDLGVRLLRVTLGSGAPAARGKAEGC